VKTARGQATFIPPINKFYLRERAIVGYSTYAGYKMVSYCFTPGIRFNDCLFSEPTPVEGWSPPQFAGLYALLAADPNWAPKAFRPLYFGEFGNATPAAAFFHDYPAPLKSGRERTVFIALLPMPFSTTSQRWMICQQLVRAYHPHYQAEAGIPGPQAVVEEKVQPRRRIGFMPQTETA
jgi:hypothetical protein